MKISKELSDCVNNLQAMDGEIQRMCNALDFAYNKAKSRGENEHDVNWVVIMGTLAAGIVLRIASFIEEIDKHFSPHKNSSQEINEAIKELKETFSIYDYQKLRDATLAHPNRLREKGKPERLIIYDEILQIVPPRRHTEYMKFGDLTNRIRQAMIEHFTT